MRKKITSYQNLFVWKKSIELVKRVYFVTARFPKHENYCLTQQMRRCAVSISSNIAEGKNRGTKKEFRRFLYIAFGSGAELETQIIIAKELSYDKSVNFQQLDGLLLEVMKILNTLIVKLK